MKRFSDVVGNFNHKRNNNFTLNYNFHLIKIIKETNYNEISMD